MTIAIGGWMLLTVAGTGHCLGGPITCAVRNGVIVRGYDTAAQCEEERRAGQVCIPALATVNR